MLKSPQAKGRRAELFVRDMLKAAGYSAQRNPMSGAIDWLKGDISSSFPFFIECKNTERSDFPGWFKKATDQALGRPVIIFWTRNHDDMYVFLKASDFLATITDKPIPNLRKPAKVIKMSLEDTAALPFSKQKQVEKLK